MSLLRFHTTLRLHQKLTRISWYKRWHEYRFAQHVHVATLIGYVLAISIFYGASFFVSGPNNALAASGTWSQMVFGSSSGGTLSNAVPRNAGIDLSLDNGTGTGNDGPLAVSGTYNINSDFVSGSKNTDANKGTRSLPDAANFSVTALTSNSATLSSTPSTGTLKAGDEVLLINLQGYTGYTTNVGNYETLTVAADVTSTTVTFSSAKTKYYGNGASDDTNIGTGTSYQRVMLQRVPNYSNVTVTPGNTLTASAWNGTLGGVLFFKVNGTLTNGGTVGMTGNGYAGGIGGYNGCSNNPWPTTAGDHAESYNGANATTLCNLKVTSGNNLLAVSPNASGGGGGGGSYQSPARNGGGGGGGGYAATGTSGSNSSTGEHGATGGASAGSANLSTLLLGSGGGGGGRAVNGLGGNGGTGGGIVFVSANTITNTGSISSNGAAGAAGGIADDDGGGGGGGAGGSVYVKGATLTLGSNLITTTGGIGGTTNPESYGTGGPGGAGSAGRIVVSAGSSTGTTNPTFTAVSFTGYTSSGSYLAPAIQQPGLYGNWPNITFNALASLNGGSAGTFLGVQVCDSSGTAISPSSGSITASSPTFGSNTATTAENNSLYGFYVKQGSGTLGTILMNSISTATYPSIRLKVNFSTSNTANTPLLNDWETQSGSYYFYDLVAPPIPTGLAKTAATSSTITLQWNSVSDVDSGQNDPTQTKYEIQRSPDNVTYTTISSGGCAAPITGTTTTTSCIDSSSLSANTQYWYRVRSKDVAGNFSRYNGETQIDDMEYGTDAAAQAAYVGSTFSATGTGGDTITTSGAYTIHTFTSSGTFVPNGSGNVEILVVGGGGGGGQRVGGGGGAGGLVYSASYPVTSGSKTVTIGGGGLGATVNSALASAGSNTVFDVSGGAGVTITANGGGAGSSYSRAGTGGSGGSGGGGNFATTSQNGGSATQSNSGVSSATGYGNGGGASYSASQYGGGGGGGAGAAGATATASVAGAGGTGLQYSQFAGLVAGSPTGYFAGGGGAGASGGTAGTGGTGGGASGGVGAGPSVGLNGSANTGGGGGGGSDNAGTGGTNGTGGTGGTGGSGVVIIRYLTNSSPITAYSETTNKTQGFLALKGFASNTSSLNQTLTKTISSPIDLSNKTTLKFDMRASRTGSNIKIGIHDSGGTVTEVTPNIAVADTYQTVSWDLSAVSNANKDVIDQIIITVTNASADNTFYLDNMYALATSNFSTQTLPSAPTGLSATPNDQSHITLNWTAPSGGASSYNIYKDGAQTPTAYTNAPTVTWQDTGLTANTQHSYVVKANNGSNGSGTDHSPIGSDSTPSVSKYTLAVNPNVTSDKTVSTWYNTNAVTFTNPAGFGAGGVTKYKYVWDTTATHSFSGDGTDWSASTLAQNMQLGNSNYLHVQSYNGDGTAGNSANYGPYYYDNAAPTGTTLSWTTINQNSVVLTPSGATDTNSGLPAAPYDVQCTKAAKTFNASKIDYDSGLVGGSAQTVSGLTANTTIACRASAVDNAGNGATTWVTPSAAYKYTLVESVDAVNFTNVNTTSLTATASVLSNPITNLGSDSTAICYSTISGSCNSVWGTTSMVKNYSSLTANTNYTYYVFTRNGDGTANSAAGPYSKYTLSNTPTLDTPASPTSNNKPPISNASHVDATLAGLTINLYEQGNGTAIASTQANASGPLAGVFTFASTSYGNNYLADNSGAAHTLLVRSVNSHGDESTNNSGTVQVIVDTSAPDVPSSFAIDTVHVTATDIPLTWGVSHDPDGDGTVLYSIERATDVGGNPGTWAVVKSGITQATVSWTDNATNNPGNSPQSGYKYWYRMRAYDNLLTNPNYSQYTAQQSAITLPGAPTLTTSTVTAASATQINVAWTFPNSGTPNHYHLYRNGTKIEVSGLSYSDTGLTDNTKYTYYVRAVSDTDANGGVEGASSSSIDRYTMANVPASISATPALNTEIDLSWPASTGNGATAYHLYRIQGSNTTQVGGDVSGTSYNDTGLSANAQYTYKVFSMNSDSPAVQSAAYATITKYTLNDTPVLDTPATPTNSNRPAFTNAGHADLNFANRTVYLYDNGGSAIATIPVNSSGVFTFTTGSYGSNTLSDGSHTQITVKADNSDSPTSFSSVSAPVTVFIDTSTPGIPTSFGTSAITSTQIVLGWTPPAADDGSPVYQIQRAVDSGGNPGTFATIKDNLALSASSWTDTGLTGNTKYWYQIKTYDNAGNNSAFSTPISATTLTGTPTGLSVSSFTTTAIALSWTAPSTGAASYNIYRDGASSPTAYVNSPTVSWTDSGLSANTQHTYIVKANNTAGGTGTDSSDPNPSVQKYTLANAPTSPQGAAASGNTGNTEIDLTWTTAGDPGTVKYHVYRVLGATTTQVGGDITATSYNDIGLSANTNYSYKIYSVNADSPAVESATFASISSTSTKPDKPVGLTATAISTTQINLSWTATSGISKYHLFRGATQIGGDIVTNSFNDTAVPAANTQYSYTVKAANGAGDGAASDAALRYSLASAPTALQLTAAGNTEIDLSWTGPSDSGTVKYHVYRILGATTTQIGGDITNNSINDTGLSANTRYTYKVYSINSDSLAAESTGYATGQKYTLTNTVTIENIPTPSNNNKPTVTNSGHPDASIASRTVKLYVDNVWYNNISTAANSNGIFTFNTASYGSNQLVDGSHGISVIVMSQENEASPQSNVQTVLVDTVTPITSVTQTPTTPNGSPDTSYYNSVPTITLVRTNSVTNVTNIIYYKWDSDSYATYSTPLANLGQGTHTLRWYSTDAAGNTETANSKTFKLDTVAPAGTAQINGGSSTYAPANVVMLDLSATDATSGVDQVMVSNSGFPLEYCSFSYSDWQTIPWDLTDSQRLFDGLPGAPDSSSICGANSINDGVKKVFVKFADAAGNVSSAIEEDVTVDSVPPTNPTAIAHPSASDSSTISDNSWYSYQSPSFELAGASDNLSGVGGYFVYFGNDSNAEPVIDGIPIEQASSGNTVFTPTLTSADSGKTFYLKVRALDIAGNVFGQGDLPASDSLLFTYKFDNTPPDAIGYISPSPGGWSATNNFSFTWQNVNDAGSGVSKYLYRRKTDPNSDTWENWDNSRSIAAGSGDVVLSNIEALYSGVDKIQVKSIDNAGNESGAIQVDYYYSGDIPAPSNLRADLSQSQNQTVNRYSFSWQVPNGITPQGFYYSVNRTPDAQNSTFIPYSSGSTISTGYAAFATQTGLNTFYVVTKANDTVGWSNFAQVNFTCNTSAPGIPQNVMITDSSARDSQRWQLTINWDQPTQVTPDFNGYAIERSTDGTNFSEIATTASQTTGYLDTNLLNSVTYSYRVKAKDNTGTKSAASTVVSKQPTGRYTEAPKLIGEPKIQVLTTKATVTFVTDRSADSFVQVGPTDKYGMTQGQLDTTETHVVNVSGLTPGTLYHYRAMWRDIDSNIGYSKDYTFKTDDAPGISEVNVSNIGLTSAIVSWKTTTVASSTVYYGTSESYGSSVQDASSSGTTTHVVKLDSLSDSTNYHFRIHCTDVEGNVIASDDYSFDTLTYPKVSDLKVVQPIDTATATFVVTWTTNVPTDSSVTCQASGSGSKSASKSMLETKHSVTVEGLLNDTNYQVTAGGRDGYGNQAQSGSTALKTLYDTRPPIISNITTETSIVGYGTDAKAQVIVSWDTDKPGTSQVQYDVGVSGSSYSQKTQADNSLTTTHVVVISGLKPSTSYHFSVISADYGNMVATSDDTSFLTDQASSSVLDVIVNSLQSTIGWIFGAFGGK